MAETKTNPKTADEVLIKNTTPVDFKAAATTEFITSDEFCNLINSVMRGVFPDAYACSVTPTPYGVLDISIAFKHDHNLADDAIQATYRIGDKKQSNDNPIINAVKNMNMTSLNQKIYDLTDIAKKALSKYMTDNFVKDETNSVYQASNKIGHIGGINWNGRMIHAVDNGNNIVIVRGFSADALAGLIHGTEIDGHTYQYNVYYVRPIGQYVNPNIPAQKYLIGISRADANEIAELAGKTNNYIQPMGNAFPNLVRV